MRANLPVLDPATVMTMLEDGATLRAVAAHFGATHQRVLRLAKSLGWKCPNGRRGNRSGSARKGNEIIYCYNGDEAVVGLVLNMGVIAVIDRADLELVSKSTWFAYLQQRGRRVFYVATQDGRSRKRIYLHRLLLNCGQGDIVDHKDGDGLNNRRTNLRLCTRMQNSWNYIRHAPTTTGFVGVLYDAGKKKPYRPYIMIDGKNVYLGSFARAEDAAKARDEAVLKHRGEFGRLNFPLAQGLAI